MIFQIVLKNKNQRTTFIEQANKIGIQIKEYSALKTILTIKTNPEQYKQIKNNPAIEYIEPEQSCDAQSIQQLQRQETYQDNWGLDRIDKKLPQLDQSYTYQRTASNVNVYVIDTGVKQDHEELQSRAFPLYDHYNEIGLENGQDGNGHGTHVAAIIAGNRFGVAKMAKIFSVKVLNSTGRGSTSSVLSGLNATLNHYNLNNFPATANMSLIFNGRNKSVDTAVLELIQAGITMVVAAGNNSDDANKYSPAGIAECLTVGAMNTIGNTDTIASFSNQSINNEQEDIPFIGNKQQIGGTNIGSKVDLFAPGVGIISAWPKRTLNTNFAYNNQTENFLGIIGVNQTVFNIFVTIGMNENPNIRIGTKNDPTLLLDGGPNKPDTLRQGRTELFVRNYNFSEAAGIYAIIETNGATAGNTSIIINVSSTNATRRLQGTSMAAPHVTGVVALRLQEENKLTNQAEVKVIHDFIVNNASINTIEGLEYGTPNKVIHQPYLQANTINWITQPGKLLDINEETFLDITLQANYVNTTGETIPITDFTSNNLGGNYSLDKATGRLSGTTDTTIEDTIINFDVKAIGELGVYDTRNFQINILDVPNKGPEWITLPGPLLTVTEGIPMNFQLSANDPENDPFTFILLNPVIQPLPDGITLSPGGLLSGVPGNLLESRVYPITIRLTDGDRINDRSFIITEIGLNSAPIWTPGSGIQDLGIFNEGDNYSINLLNSIPGATDPDNDPLIFNVSSGILPGGILLDSNGMLSGVFAVGGTSTFSITSSDTLLSSTMDFSIEVISSTINLPPSFITPSGSLGDIDEGSSSNFIISANDSNNDLLSFILDLAPGDIFPPGLSLQSNGLITGVSNSVNNHTTFNFGISLSDGINEVIRRFSITVLNVFGNLPPEWVTVSGLIGELNEDQPSLLSVRAVDPNNDELSYQISSGSPPPGIHLDIHSGQFIGIAPSVSIDTEYEFGVTVSNNSLSTPERFFSIRVLDINVNNTLNVCIPFFGPDKDMLSSLSKAIMSKESSYIFRPNDPSFGIPVNFDMYLVHGLNLPLSGDIDSFILSLDTHSFNTSIILGDIKNAIVMSGSEVLYEVIYIEVIDPAYSSSDVLYPQDIINILTPPSIESMRERLISEYMFVSSELYPSWMSSFAPGIILSYTKPGHSVRILSEMDPSLSLTGRVMDIDRYLITTSSSLDQTTFGDVSFDSGSTTFDLSSFKLFNQHIKFPQTVINSPSSLTGDILGVLPGV